jgi:hypothetical protein
MKRGSRAGKRQTNIPRDQGDILVKRLTYQAGTQSSTAGGVIAVTTAIGAALVQSAPAAEWASFAARFQQYRVRSVRLILEPAFPGSGTPTVSVNTAHSTLYVSDFIGTSAPTTAAQILSDEGAVILNTSKRVDFTVDWARNPNAKLWNPTSAALPAANSFSIAFASDSVAANLPASIVMYSTTVEWVVEFRGSQ